MAYKQKSLGGPLNKMFKRNPKKLAERNQRRHKRNLRVDWDPNEIDDFNKLYDSGDFETIQKDARYSKGSGQGGTDVGNHLRMMKKNMMLPNGQTNTQPPKENEKTEIKKTKIDKTFYGNTYVSNKNQAEIGSGGGINQFEKDQWNNRWLKQYPQE
jgi:hypothetical protein|tara:strand:+ start:25 stop:492 length:468 start_codon:yes stop_codon:yes gene_type:complete